MMVIGVGNGGVNAVNQMARANLAGVRLVAVDTDAQVLGHSQAEQIVQIGEGLTGGRGTGGRPEVAQRAALEKREQLADLLKGLDMVFFTAGLGGGTGTGAGPVIAGMAKNAGILSIAIVTKPFSFEGFARMERAKKGLESFKKNVDALIVIPNDKLLEVAAGAPLTQAFELADEVLRRGVQGITDLVTLPGMINLNLSDVDAVLRGAGMVMIGLGEGKGERKTREALEQAVQSPLLEQGSIRGSTKVIINITGGSDLSLREATEAAALIKQFTGVETDITFGVVIKDELHGAVRITVIATGLQEEAEEEELKPRRVPREEIRAQDLEIPAFMRKRRKDEEAD
ncbi:MAG: cell division protein FtsZ [Candidatus Acetothermia bacterium]|nr:cell division protein FtsZ [Candidatus Acetothermia bacterium]